MGFVESQIGTSDQLNTFPSIHIFHHFWVGATANPPKNDDKYAQKNVQLVKGSSFPSDFLQNPYFRIERE